MVLECVSPANSDRLTISDSSVTRVSSPQLNTAPGQEYHGASLIIMVSISIICSYLTNYFLLHHTYNNLTCQTWQILFQSQTIFLMFSRTLGWSWWRQSTMRSLCCGALTAQQTWNWKWILLVLFTHSKIQKISRNPLNPQFKSLCTIRISFENPFNEEMSEVKLSLLDWVELILFPATDPPDHKSLKMHLVCQLKSVVDVTV